MRTRARRKQSTSATRGQNDASAPLKDKRADRPPRSIETGDESVLRIAPASAAGGCRGSSQREQQQRARFRYPGGALARQLQVEREAAAPAAPVEVDEPAAVRRGVRRGEGQRERGVGVLAETEELAV